MKTSLLLCFALVLGGLWGSDCLNVLASPTAAVQSGKIGEKAWQTTLRVAVTNSYFPPYGSLWVMFYTVPADAAKVLESQSPAELMSFLKKLRASQSSWEAGTVDEWLIIVCDGLRGTPEVITNTLTNAKGEVVSTTEIPVYTYADHFLRHTVNRRE